jgi:YVTN family beta-propeller protein
MNLRALPVSLLLALAATAGQAQYVEDSIDVGGAWVTALAYNTHADVVYGVSQSSYYLFTIDCASGTVQNRLYRNAPVNVVYDSIDNKAYLAQRSGVDSILVVDGSTHQRIKAIPMYWAGGMVWNAANNRLYVAGGDEDVVRVIDCATDSVIAVIPVSGYPTAVRLSTRHPKLYVLNWDSETVAIVNTETNVVVATIPLGTTPDAGCYSGNADKFYCGGASAVTVVDGDGDSLLGRVSLPIGVLAYCMTSVEEHGLVVVGGQATKDSIFFIDAHSDSIVATFAVDGQPHAVVWSPATDLVYCANTQTTSSVMAIAGDASRVLAELQTAYFPSTLLTVARHRRLYVGHSGSRWVYVVCDSATGVAERPAELPPGRHGLSADPVPFAGLVTLQWEGHSRIDSVAIYTNQGRLVRRLESAGRVGDRRGSIWDGRDTHGHPLPDGVYVAVLEGGKQERTKLVKLR